MRQSSLPAPSPLFSGRWDAVVDELSRTIDLEATARQFKALQRVRKVRSAEDLLRLAMIWGPGRQSYRETAALAAHGKIVDMSDKGIVGRMRRTGDWLAHILASLLAARTNRPRAEALDVSVIDGSVICSPGKAEDWRLHARTAEAAGFLMLVTSLPVRGHSTRQVVDRYPDRWQVEIGFKRFKTLGRIDELPAADPDLARTWLLAHLIAAVLIDDLVNEIVAFPP